MNIVSTNNYSENIMKTLSQLASYINMMIWVLLKMLVFGTCTLVAVSDESNRSAAPHCKFGVRGVNLGGWLLIEGWIQPSLFQGIPNKDFLDGTVVQFKSVTTQKYLCAQSGGGDFIVASCTTKCASSWENFRLWRMNESTFRIRVHKDQFVGLDGIQVVAVANSPTHSETFEIIKESNVSNRVRIKVSNGFFLQAKTKNLVTADVSEVSGWKNNDPTIFNLTIVSQINGDWQLQNGYGPEAPRVMKKHYDTFITKKDFKFMKENGINTVRIPVGWWTTKDPNPPFPFVRGTLRALDNAFSWAKEYKLKVILDLHSAPYSQNGVAISTTRDGSLKWGQTNETIQQTLEVIDFFAARYEKHKSLYGIELLNEPLYPCVPLKIIEEYYRTAYSVVRRYNPEVYVILSSRVSFTLADMPSPQELFPLANSLENSVVDVHWYHLYYDIFTDMKSVKEHFDYIEHNRTKQMTELLEKSGKARIYIGEWSAAWDVENATKEEVQQFVKAQIELYDRATFGWCFWTFKNVQNNWSLKWLIENGYIKLPVSKPEMISSGYWSKKLYNLKLALDLLFKNKL